MLSRVEKNKKERKKIESTEKKKKTKSILVKIFKVFIITFIVLLAVFISLRYIANLGIVVREYSLRYNNLPSSFDGFKIVQFGDIYYNPYSNDINYYVEKINELKPDLVLFSGGLKHKDYNLDDASKEYLIKTLKKIDSTVGKYYVIGNNDDDNSIKILNDSGFVSVIDKTEKIYFQDSNPIILRGISSIPNINYENDSNIFKINLVYEPDLTDSILEYNNPELIFASKSINGQFRLPYLKGLIKKSGYMKYNEKEYTISNTKLLITGGLGTNNYPVRLFNHPSINFVRLQKADN